MKIRAPLALLALAILGCGGHHHHSSSSPVKETTARTVAAINYVYDLSSGIGTEQVVTFRTTDVKTILTNVAVTGLDTIVDTAGKSRPDFLGPIDQRPATKELYAMSNYGTLYKLNPTTGVATKVATVATLNSLLSNNKASLQDIDFDPTTDQLRVTLEGSEGGSAGNLRLNPDTGAVVGTDTPFTRNGSPADAAIAYTPSGSLFALTSAASSTLNYVDLVKVASPSAGVMQSFTNLLTVYYDGYASFDISTDGTTGIFLDVDDDEVFLIDIATGTARSIGTLTLASTPTVASVAFFDAAS